jgi:pimeloyl-ACP methyl ester carboxylesterase
VDGEEKSIGQPNSFVTLFEMDLLRQRRDQILHVMDSKGRLTWTFGSTALLALAIIAYHRTHRKPILIPTDLPKKTLDRVLRLRDASDAKTFDPPLLQKHSTFESYTTPYATYPSIRTLYHPHPQGEKLPQDSQPLPLLVFLHGLGGSLAQFAPLLGSLVNIAPCLGIDLPGCGLSKFESKSWDAYSIEAMVTLLVHVVDQHKTIHGHRDVVLIGHSMGCSIAALLASTASPVLSRLKRVAGCVAICPKGTPPTKKEAWYFSKILSMPDFLLDIMRWFDKRGGDNSPSVIRFVGEQAGPDLRRLQLRFNSSFPTSVWKRVAWGCLPMYDEADEANGGMPGRSVWAGLKVPLLLIAGQADKVTKPEEVSKIVSFLKNSPTNDVNESAALPTEGIESKDASKKSKQPDADDSRSGVQPSTTESKSQHSTVIKTAILPAPATHALLYDPATYRTLAGLIEDFLSRHISHRLNLGWQLQQLTTSGKWDVKNLKKWKGVAPISEPIAGGIFRGIKTLREQDEEHTPAMFTRTWSDKIYAIIDISHDRPVYDAKELEENGIQYHKFPTVSKIPPTAEEVRDFIALVDQLRAEIDQHRSNSVEPKHKPPAIAVHCHYGYNRTGFFIISYLIEKEGYRVQDAIDEFQKQRPPGIRHEHFIDTLFVRYCVGLKRAPTVQVTA